MYIKLHIVYKTPRNARQGGNLWEKVIDFAIL